MCRLLVIFLLLSLPLVAVVPEPKPSDYTLAHDPTFDPDGSRLVYGPTMDPDGVRLA